MNMNLIKKSYKRRMFFCFLTLSLIFILISGLFSVQIFRMKINREFVQNDIEACSAIGERLTGSLTEIEAVIGSIRDNSTLREAAEGKETDARKVNSELFASTGSIREFSVTDIHRGRECAYSTSVVETEHSIPDYFFALKKASQNTDTIVYSAGPAGGEGHSALRAVGKLGSEGYCVVRIDAQGFDTLIKNLVGSGKGFFLVNTQWEPVYEVGTASDETLALFRSNLFSGAAFDSGFSDNAYAFEIGDTGLWGIYITPPVMISSAVKSMYNIILLLAFISMGLSMFMSNRLSVSLTRPIGKLINAMKSLRSGNLSTRMKIENEDEFGQLAAGFNKMSEQLEKYVNERIEREKELNRTQIGMVTAQLNPHFLYNTLDTIKWLAKDSGEQTIADLSTKLAKILRRSISGPAFCRLDEELELIGNYCDIQAVRFDNKFEIGITAEPEVRDCIIPKLIIQPVVENSIIHGLQDQDSGRITIEARKIPDEDSLKGGLLYENREAGQPVGGDLVITVTDNGCGIDAETVEKLNKRDREAMEGHIGLLNVDTIIRLNYGERYGVVAAADGEKGTRVTITLPAMKDNTASGR